MTDFWEEDLERARRFRAPMQALQKIDAARSMADGAIDGVCIYFALECRSGSVKIGVTENLKRRLAAIRTNSPHEIVLLAQIPGDERLETYVHDSLSACHIRGEWYRFTPEMFSIIETLRAGAPVLSEEEQILAKKAIDTWAEPLTKKPNRKRLRDGMPRALRNLLRND